jgi:hypothetical protein
VDIVGLDGRTVRGFTTGNLQPGQQQISLDPAGLVPGVYYAIINSMDGREHGVVRLVRQ